ncbi:unnamed protein product [Hymenolepis diminuta]|uniref:Uncharacterized protein n=1 Tax=Hymenolepis diminuta TaxID=6216 RepID=A0A564YV77_HYMDI|nr:unnamed protein product [Hymenolepis diminuta]
MVPFLNFLNENNHIRFISRIKSTISALCDETNGFKNNRIQAFDFVPLTSTQLFSR